MKRALAMAVVGLSLAFVTGTGTGVAAPLNSHSPNVEDPFEVVCGTDTYTLVDAPASTDHADFTPAFIVGTNKIVVPYMFDATQTATVLTDGAVLDGVTYNAGDVLFSGSEQSGHGTQRAGGRSCTFGGSGVEAGVDDNGNPVQISFIYSGVAMVKFPNS